jgi:hypothetical protein
MHLFSFRHKLVSFPIIFLLLFAACKSSFQKDPIRFSDDYAVYANLDGQSILKNEGECKVLSKDRIIYALIVFPLNRVEGPKLNSASSYKIKFYNEVNLIDGVITLFGALLGFRAETAVFEDCGSSPNKALNPLETELLRLEATGVPIVVLNLKAKETPKSFRHTVVLKENSVSMSGFIKEIKVKQIVFVVNKENKTLESDSVARIELLSEY